MDSGLVPPRRPEEYAAKYQSQLKMSSKNSMPQEKPAHNENKAQQHNVNIKLHDKSDTDTEDEDFQRQREKKKISVPKVEKKESNTATAKPQAAPKLAASVKLKIPKPTESDMSGADSDPSSDEDSVKGETDVPKLVIARPKEAEKKEAPKTASEDGPGQVQYYQCDACHSYPLATCRFHCLVCPDYDLCQKCYTEGTKEHDGSHPMQRLAIQEAITKLNGELEAEKRRQRAKRDNNDKQGDKGTGKQGRKRTTARNTAAGAAMDLMNNTLTRCSIGPSRPSSVNTRAAQNFNKGFAAGREVYKRLDYTSVEAQLIALNAIVLAGIPLPGNRGGKSSPIGEYVEVDCARVVQVGLSIVELFVAADEQQWFCEPVSLVEVPEYAAVIKTPMDLSLIKKWLETAVEFGDSSIVLEGLRKRLRQMWANAKKFNDPSHPVHIAAEWYDVATTQIMEQTARLLKVRMSKESNAAPYVFRGVRNFKALFKNASTNENKKVSLQPMEIVEAVKPSEASNKRRRVTTPPVVATDSALSKLRAEVADLKKQLNTANSRVNRMVQKMKSALGAMGKAIETVE